jgi:hypothetical protein
MKAAMLNATMSALAILAGEVYLIHFNEECGNTVYLGSEDTHQAESYLVAL